MTAIPENMINLVSVNGEFCLVVYRHGKWERLGAPFTEGSKIEAVSIGYTDRYGEWIK